MIHTKALTVSIFCLLLNSCGSDNSPESTAAIALAQALQACSATSCLKLTISDVAGACNAIKATSLSTQSSNPVCQTLMATITLNCMAQSCTPSLTDQTALSTALTKCLEAYETQNQAEVAAACKAP